MLNWLTRYAPALDALEDAGSILDVGCGSHGLACVLPDRPFVGADIAFPGATAPSMVPVVVDEEQGLPFPDGAFDTVLCLDALEHVPPDDRAGFVADLARVAARRLVLACPTDAAAPLDAIVRGRHLRAGVPVPTWLQEHDACGLPTIDEIAGCIAALGDGFEVSTLDMPDGLLCSMIVLADTDLDPVVAGAARDAFLQHGRDWTRLLREARFGQSFRAGLVVDRVAAPDALVPGGLAPGALAAAVAALPAREPAEEVMAAPEPAPVAAPTPVVAPGPAPLDTRADLALWLSPADWCRPETWLPALSRYVAQADPSGSTCLCLDACEREELSTAAITELIATACERLAGDGPFAEVLIVDAPADLSRCLAVRDGGDVSRALGRADRAQALDLDDPEAVVDAARWAKALADDLRALADRVRFEAAPDPFAEARPLVSVRIPTWNGVDALVGSTIPSVLMGSYQHVEVLVCSDGPDPACRAAVEAIPDERVRYLELPERPVHPGHPWSFWETTGLRPANAALDAARGSFVAPLDHDDRFTHDHVRDLLEAGARAGADFVHGQALCERRDGGPPNLVGAERLAHGHVCHGAVLYSARLAHLRYDPHCWLLEEPGDWNMWRRMQATGARTAYVPRTVLLHTAERTSIEESGLDATALAVGVQRTAADLAPDVLGTDARWLLDVAVPAAARRGAGAAA